MHTGKNSVPLSCDNQTAVAIIEDPICDSNRKHLSLHWYFVGERAERQDISIQWAPTRQHLSDILQSQYHQESSSDNELVWDWIVSLAECDHI
jgi:hypothetical protein